LNEEKGIKKVVSHMPEYVDKVVVVDNNSTDHTADVAESLGALVLHEEHRGKGNAIKHFIRWLKEHQKFDYVVMLDGDYTYNPAEKHKVLEPLVKDEADVVMGSRLAGNLKENAMPRVNWFGNKLLTFAAQTLYWNFSMSDLCTGYWAFRAECMRNLHINANSFDLEADMYSRARKKGYRVVSVPITYGARVGNEKLRVGHAFGILKKLIVNRFS
jgi:glycosyltransferase involved in cell wall biosynthesis